MYFNEDHKIFRQSVRQFIETEVVPNAERWETDRHIPKSILKRMGDLGYLGLIFPEKYTGVF